jgi:two-component system sensor histidine kinase GraS
MNKLKILLIYISSNRVWIITLACLDLFFIFLAWLANPDYFINYAALIEKCREEAR